MVKNCAFISAINKLKKPTLHLVLTYHSWARVHLTLTICGPLTSKYEHTPWRPIFSDSNSLFSKLANISQSILYQ